MQFKHSLHNDPAQRVSARGKLRPQHTRHTSRLQHATAPEPRVRTRAATAVAARICCKRAAVAEVLEEAGLEVVGSVAKAAGASVEEEVAMVVEGAAARAAGASGEEEAAMEVEGVAAMEVAGLGAAVAMGWEAEGTAAAGGVAAGSGTDTMRK